jgi:hypothetical protein
VTSELNKSISPANSAEDRKRPTIKHPVNGRFGSAAASLSTPIPQ